MLRSQAWILDGAEVHALRPRDIDVVVRLEPFEVTSDLGARPAPMYVRTSADICFDDALDPAEGLALDVRTC